jgi:hypothetical protein
MNWRHVSVDGLPTRQWHHHVHLSSNAQTRVSDWRMLRASWIASPDLVYTIAVVLLIAWLLGIVGTYTIGAFVNVLLVIALVLFVVGPFNHGKHVCDAGRS